MLKVLVVDDSALMRRQLRQILEDTGEMEVQTARNGQEALERIGEFEPEVVTLDVNMPVMDGLTCLENIMRTCPRPVVMVSSITAAASDAAIRALSLGALDVITKPDGTVSLNLERMRLELIGKVKVAGRGRPRRVTRLREALRAERAAGEERRAIAALSATMRTNPSVTLIGVSTGGPRTLEDILPEFPTDFLNAVVVAQHMPAAFTQSFARRMDSICAIKVMEVDRPTPLLPGHAYIGRGDADVVVERRLGRLVVNSVPSGKSAWHPSVDRLVRSAMAVMPAAALIGVQLTGMGDDGAEAMTLLRAQGGRTVAESEETAAVFGMPAELIRRGGATAVLPSDRIAELILGWTSARSGSWGC
ncbi:chemotaxis-specific protein-glutamate methyltransferase CheB [Acidisoma sp.]|uniref:chemotaxis-specific protein-glutamate methyltransferase CheB n=1 Tax=Acidisoma sp. TaxID=1872115 RepID=UPI003AFFEC0D